MPARFDLHDKNDSAQRDEFLRDVVEGMRKAEKHLPCKYFYDQRGCELFDRICELDEYYLTRTELSIMREHAAEMSACLGPNIVLIEYGSGRGVKTRLLLGHLREPTAYVPVDIAQQHLQQSVNSLAEQFPTLPIYAVCEDFSRSFSLPNEVQQVTPRFVYFPGSTMGNFSPKGTARLLSQIAHQCGRNGGLVIGLDLQKDKAVLEAAYDDPSGVTAQFNLNLLGRINNELGADFDLGKFRHRAIYNETAKRIEMHVVSLVRQAVHIRDHIFELHADETICTEYSYKYELRTFDDLAREAGLRRERLWTDEREYFAVVYYSVA